MRSKGEYLGSVEAPDRESAEAVAIKQFEPDDDQRSRLLIRERALVVDVTGATLPHPGCAAVVPNRLWDYML